MKKSLLRFMTLGLITQACSVDSSQLDETKVSDNVAYKDATVRFTVISDGAIRMEYAADGQFIDNASFIATERLYTPSKYSLKDEGENVEIETSKMKLVYKKNSGAFTADNLSITSGAALSKTFEWHPGDKQEANLGGTYRTLDGYDGDVYWAWNRSDKENKPLPMEDGVIARDGWTLIDDSNGLLFERIGDGDLDWIKVREAKGTVENSDSSCNQDFYFLAYGDDYKAALADYTKFAGKIPLPPRYVFGYWWSRYWAYSDAEMRKLVADFEAYDIPLDVLVVDMDWHWVEPGKGGWTGYTWNERLFPNPKLFLDFLRSKNLQITLNLHPADGVPAYEDKYAALAEFLGRDPQSKETIRWQSSDRRFMRGWLDKMLKPLEEEGVNFWWLDWQQGLMDDSIPALSNTWWINYCVFQNQVLNGTQRPMLYHRWGGLGNHRYQIGFSGDTYSTWASLAYQPYFNTTASNVGYGYWSHDLGGHMFVNDGDVLDKELYTRWMQLGTFLPVMRSHSTKNANMSKEPWNLGQPYMPAVTESIKLRYRLAPYIYTAAREAFDTGVSLCRPLYYDYPEDENAYAEAFRNEYLFGNDILVAPIVEPMTDGVSTLDVYLPEGKWFEITTGKMLAGGKVHQRHFLIDEFPVYVKAGAIIPTYGNDVKNMASNDEKVTLVVMPTCGKCTSHESLSSLYEDNGNDKDYANNFARTAFSNTISENIQTIKIGCREGSYKGMPKSREYALSLRCANLPKSVTLDSKPIAWTYDGTQLAVNVELGNLDPNREHSVEIKYNAEEKQNLATGIVGKMRRIANAMTAMKFRNAGINYIEGFGQLGSTVQMIEYKPGQFNEIIDNFNQNYNRLPELIDKQRMSDTDKAWFLNMTCFDN